MPPVLYPVYSVFSCNMSRQTEKLKRLDWFFPHTWRPFKRLLWRSVSKTRCVLKGEPSIFSASQTDVTLFYFYFLFLQRGDKYRRSVHHPPSYPGFPQPTLCRGYCRTNLPSSFALRAGVTIGQIVHPLPLPPLVLCLPRHRVDMPAHLVVFFCFNLGERCVCEVRNFTD